MSTHSRGPVEYQRITQPDEEGENNERDPGENGRILLPHERTAYANEWEERWLSFEVS